MIRSRAIAKAMKHQLVSLKHDEANTEVFDMSDPGTGKTFVRIMAFARDRKKGGGCMLVLAPRSLLRAAWANDFAKFAPHLKVSVATANNREEAFAASADVYITNHDAAKWLIKQKPAFWAKFKNGHVAADEATAYKHHTSQRSKAALRIFQPKERIFKKRIAMTATPTSNGICDVWHQVALLDGGKRLGGSFYGFRNSVCTPQQMSRFNAHAVKWHDKEGAEEAVFGLISDIVIRHRIEDCVDIPATHIYSVEYELTPKQRKAYDDMSEAQILMLSKKKGGPSLSAVNAAAVQTKLCQIASGAVYDNDGKPHIIDNSRYESIIDMCEVRKHPIVFFFWKHQRDALVAEAESRGLTYAVLDGDASDKERAAVEVKYQLGHFDILFGHPKTVAHGFTFTAGTSTIWTSPTPDLEWWKQGNRRQARIGQKHKTEIVVCLATNTLEERIYNEILMPKDGRMSTLLDLFATNQLVPA